MKQLANDLPALRRLCVCAAIAIDRRAEGIKTTRDYARALKTLRIALRYLQAFDPKATDWEKQK